MADEHRPVSRGVHATALVALHFYDRLQGNHRGTVDRGFSWNGELRVLSDASCSSDRSLILPDNRQGCIPFAHVSRGRDPGSPVQPDLSAEWNGKVRVLSDGSYSSDRSDLAK